MATLRSYLEHHREFEKGQDSFTTRGKFPSPKPKVSYSLPLPLQLRHHS